MSKAIMGKDVRIQVIIDDKAFDISGQVNSMSLSQGYEYDNWENNFFNPPTITYTMELSLTGWGAWSSIGQPESSIRPTIDGFWCPFCKSSPVIPNNGCCPRCGGPLGINVFEG